MWSVCVWAVLVQAVGVVRVWSVPGQVRMRRVVAPAAVPLSASVLWRVPVLLWDGSMPVDEWKGMVRVVGMHVGVFLARWHWRR